MANFLKCVITIVIQFNNQRRLLTSNRFGRPLNRPRDLAAANPAFVRSLSSFAQILLMLQTYEISTAR